MYTVYIIQSKVSGKYYKGQTNDLARRLKEHNNKEEKSTLGGAPWVLVFSAVVSTRSAAMELERKVKNITSKKKMEAFLMKYRDQ